MLIYVNGCSHSIGVRETYSWSYVLGKSICRDIKYDNHYGIDELTNVDTNTNILYNFADSGKGNDLIFHETIEFISKCKNENTKPDYIFIQFSGSNRLAKQRYDGQMQLLTPAETEYIDELNFEPYASKTTLSYILSLQELFKSMNIEYFFCCYMELDNSIINSPILNQIDLTKFISIDSSTHPILGGFRNKMRYNGYIMDGNGHPSFYGHWFIANKFLDKLNINNLDIGFFESLKLVHSKSNFNKLKLVNWYDDFMITKRMVKSNYKKLDEGTEEDKVKLKRSIF